MARHRFKRVPLERLKAVQIRGRLPKVAAAVAALVALTGIGVGALQLTGSDGERNDAADRCRTDPEACATPPPGSGISGYPPPNPTGTPGRIPTGTPTDPAAPAEPGTTPPAPPPAPPPAGSDDPAETGRTPAQRRPLIASDRFISDLDFSRAYNGLGPVERDRRNGRAAPGDGGAMSIDGRRFERGLGVHADSAVQVVLGGSCTRFTARVGVDDVAETDAGGDGTQVVFSVLADAKLVYRSPVLERGDAPARVDVDVTGATRLDLVVDDLGYAFGDHADWADARVRCKG